MEDVYWVSHRDLQGNLLCCPAYLVTEGDDATFREYSTDFEFTDRLGAIVASVADPESLDVVPEDLVESDEVNETAVLWSIKKKFKDDVIYTSIGTILIAMNPYRMISSMYSKEKLDIYKNEAMHSRGIENFDTSPHIWSIARSAYVHLLKQAGKRQAIIISGESGAGKTEATKKIMTFLSYVSTTSIGTKAASSRHQTEKDEKEAIEHKVLMTNPLLESFGNAKTSRNDNSSRFGKWLEIVFQVAGAGGAVKLSGAHIVHYLLEKSRVVSQAKGERNFHVFYQLFSNDDLKLGAMGDYLYLNTSGCTMIAGVNDGANGKDTQKSLDDLSVSRENQRALYIALKGILCLGNIAMEAVRDDDDLVTCTSGTKQALKNAADSFGLSAEALENGLATKKITAGADTTEVHLTPVQAAEARNALAKEVYNRLFAFIIETANQSLEQHVGRTAQQDSNEPASRSAFTTSVGLLDIFGFEIFALNSLEQLSINFANEKLQQYFLHYVLKREQEIYEAEGIDCERIIPPDNQDLIDLFEMPQTGLFARLNEEVKLPKGSDGSFLRKVVTDQTAARKRLEEAGGGDAPVRFVKDVKMAVVEFSINHFAGTVCYTAEGFVEKNKDRLFDHLDALLLDSFNRPFALMMGAESKQSSSSSTSKGGPSSKKLTIIQDFTTQLSTLMQVLGESNPHFVRCIKPNETKSSAIFNEDLVLQQLRYSGVLEAIQIRKKGFPVRRTHREFRWLYGPLCAGIRADLHGSDLSEHDKCELVVGTFLEEAADGTPEVLALFDSNISIGKTMVFFRHNLLKHLEHRRHELRVSKIPLLQRFGRVARAISRVRALRKGVAELDVLNKASLEHEGRNYQVHDELKLKVRHCEEDLGMLPLPVLKLAKERLEVLETIKGLMDEVAAMCEPGADTRFSDILAMHDEARGLLEAAMKLGFKGPDGPSDEVNRLFQLETSIAAKANLLRRFRAAIAAAKEDDIRECLALVGELSVQDDSSDGGSKLFEEERETAARILVKIDADNARIKQAVEVCAALLREEDSVFSDRSSPRLLEFQKGVTETLIGFKTDPPAGEATSQFISLMRDYSSVLAAWKGHEWDVCAEKARNVKKALGTLSSEGPGRLGSPVLLTALTDTVGPLGHAILHRIVPDIETNLSLPQLGAAVSKGPVTAVPCLVSKVLVGAETFIRINSAHDSGLRYFHIDRSTISCDELASAIDNVKAMELGSEEGLAMLPMLKALVNVRKFVAEGQWMDVMRQSCPEDEMKTWEQSYSGVIERLRGAADVSGPAVSAFPDPDLVPYVNPNDDRFLNDFFSVAKVTREFEIARDYAALQLTFESLIAPIMEGSAVSAEEAEVRVGPLNAIIQEASLVEDSSSPISAFVDVLRVLKYLRTRFSEDDDDAWAAVISRESEDDWNDLSYSHLDDDDLQSRQDTPMLQCMTLVRDELAHIVRHAKSKVAERDLRAAFRTGNYCGSHDTVSFTRLEAVIEATPSDDLLNPYAAALLNISLLLLKARKIFSRKDLDVPMAKRVVDSLSSYLAAKAAEANLTGNRGSSMSMTGSGKHLLSSDSIASRRRSSEYVQSMVGVPELVTELQHMHSDIDFADCLTMIEEGLQLPSPVSYVLSLSEEGAGGQEMGVKAEGGGDDADDKKSAGGEGEARDRDAEVKTPSPPSGPSPTPADPSRFLAADGLTLNKAALNTQKLSAGLEVAKEATKFIKNVLPKHLRVIRCAELIKRMRENVRIGNWIEAFQAFSSIKEAELLTTVPLIQAEVVSAADTICNYYVIVVCRKALSSGFARGKIGLIDKKKIDPSKLDDAHHLCAEIGCTNERALALREAVWLMAELRRAQISGNWNSINEAMKKIEEAGIGSLKGYTDCCYEEVSWAKIERDNHEVTVQVVKAIVDEALSHKDSFLDIAAVRVTALQAAYLRGTAIKEKYRGLVLVEVLSLADIVLKARKAVQLSNWFALNSLTSLWKAEVEEFQVQMESLEVGDHSMHRGGSILRRSSMLAPSAKAPGESSSRKPEKKFDLWPLFSKAKDQMSLELLYIEQHFVMQELELEINTALRSGGMSLDMLGDVDTDQIDPELITAAIEKRKQLEARGMTLSDQLKSIFNAAVFILRIRIMVKNHEWEGMRAVMEDAMTQTSTGLANTLPDVCRKELEYVRYESENRWIVGSMESAVKAGQMLGTVDQIDIDCVSFSHLVPIIGTCREMTPRTDKAVNLVYTGEALVPLRRIITSRPVDWGALLSQAGAALKPSSVVKLDTLVLPEIRLMEAVASEKLLCANLSQCLGRFGPKGHPGNLDLTHTSTEEIEDAVMIAVNSGVKSIRGSQLLVACRDMVVLRRALLASRSEDEDTSREGWATLRRVVMTLFERHDSGSGKSQPPSPGQGKDASKKTVDTTAADTDKPRKEEEGGDAGWAICKHEVDFISKDAHVEEVRMNLESNIKKTIAVYALRLQVPCDPLEDHQALNKAARKAADGSLSIHVEVLTKILEYAEGLDFDNAILTRYRKVCGTLKTIRTCVINDDFKDLKKILFTDKTVSELKAVPVALEELQFAKMEFQNEAGISILEASIRYTKHAHEHHESGHGDYAKAPSYQLSSNQLETMKDFCRVHDVPESEVTVDPHSLPPVTQPYLFMYVAIRIVKQSAPAYLMLKELLECAVHVYQLRVGFASGESKEVSSALKWLRSEGTHCPRQLQNEAKVAYVDHKNNLLRERITKALRTGRASHMNGEVDVSTLVTEDLRQIIEQAKEFKSSLTLDMIALVEAAESLLVLRKAQKEGDLVGLHDYLQLLAEYNRSHARKLHSMIIDEVASMLRALHNEMSQAALRCSLDAFVKQNHKPLPDFVEQPGVMEDAFLQIVGNTVYYEYVHSCDSIKSSGSRAYPTMHAIGSVDYVADNQNAGEAEDPGRHYCFDNIHRSDVSVLTIDTTLFDEALMISKEKGVYGSQAKRLLRTVLMMRALRIAMRQQDWHKVDSILTKNSITLRSGALFEPSMLPSNFDKACALEIYVIQHQLEMRAAILDVFDCLKRGWARCSNGIVDTSCIAVEDLENAVKRCESSIMDAQSGNESSESMADGTATAMGSESQQGKIFSLLRSATIVCKARRLLLVGMLKEAGELASAAVNRDKGPSNQLSTSSNPTTILPDEASTDQALQSLVGEKKVHEAVMDELQLYAAEVHCALKLADLVTILRQGITDGDSQELESLIQDSQSMMMQQSLRLNDLGLIRVLQRAQLVYRTLQKARKLLLKCTHSHDKSSIAKALSNARKLRLKDPELIDAVEARLHRLTELEGYMKSLSAHEGGVISSTAKFRLAAHKAVDLDLSLHPAALLAEVGKHLKYSSLRRLHLGQALSRPASSRLALDSEGRELGFNAKNFHVESDADMPFTMCAHTHGLPYAAATHTMRVKRAYLSHASVRKRYKLDQFPPLRDPLRFSLRMGVANQNLQTIMLSYQETNLPTSITQLRPELAALSVWIFAHVIRGLENSTFTRIEVRLRDMIRLGREIPSMRDELLLQLVKQLNKNPHPNNTDRLWRCLACCLAHFPPSSKFENFLELHLFRDVEAFEKEIAGEKEALAKIGEVPPKDTSHLIKSSIGTDAMAPVKSHQKDTSPEEQEKTNTINDRIDRLRHRLRWARHCVRLLHEGCFLYGNDRAVAQPYDQSLERFLLWLVEPQAVVMMLRCQAPQDDSETPEKWNLILSAQGKRHDDDGSPSKGKPDKTVPKAMLKIFEDPGWTDDISTQEVSHDQASATAASTGGTQGSTAQAGGSVDGGDDGEAGGMMKMQATSQTHLTKSAFTVGASLFGKFETIKEEGEVRKAPGASSSSTLLSTVSTAATSGKSNRAMYSAFPAKLISDLVGGSGKIYGSHRYWSHNFHKFANSQSITPEAAAVLKEKVHQARRSLRASRALMSSGGLSGKIDGISEEGEEDFAARADSDGNIYSSSESDEEDGVRAAHRHLVVGKDAFLHKMCEICLHSRQEDLSLEEEVLCFLLGEGQPTRVAEALRWYNYNMHSGSEPLSSPFFSDGENEQSSLRTQWMLQNISIPEKERFTLPAGFKSRSESDSDNSSEKGSEEEEEEDEDEERSSEEVVRAAEARKKRKEEEEEEEKRRQIEEEDPASNDLARVTVNGTLFWETVLVPVCRKYGLHHTKDDAKEGPSSEAKEQSAISSSGAKRGSVFASQYIKSLSSKAAGTRVGLDMRLYRDLVQAGIVLFVQLMQRQKAARAAKQPLRKQDVVIRFRTPRPPTAPPPASRVLGDIPDDEQTEPQVFHMYTRSKAAADGTDAAPGGRAETTETDRKLRKRDSLFVKFSE